MSWDTVVIGSGVAGLTAAVALARAGQRVLVVEQRDRPGGVTHGFAIDGHRFSPGVRYVGECGPRGAMRELLEGLGVTRDLEMCEMNPDGFDHYLVGRDRIDQPQGLERWKTRLFARFPEERRGIEKYFRVMARVAHDLQKCDEARELPAVLSLPFRTPHLIRHGFGRLAPLVDACVHDPLLAAILSAQCGNDGLAPSHVSLPAHAAMTAHFWNGAFYPRGGARRIAEAFVKELRRHGGSIRTCSRVARVRVDSERAIGVELDTGEFIAASDVVCNADPARTYGTLVPEALCPSEARKAHKTEDAASVLSCFCLVDMPLRRMGYDSGNYWFYRTRDVDGLQRRAETEMPGIQIDSLFVAIPTLKDPEHAGDGPHTVEVSTFVPYAPFSKWNGAQARSAPEYVELKRCLGAKMVYAADSVIHGFSRHVKVLDVRTPTAPRLIGPFSFSHKSELEHFHMCGASVSSYGVFGASLGGLTAAQHVLGLAHRNECLAPPDGSLRVYPADHPEMWPQHVAA